MRITLTVVATVVVILVVALVLISIFTGGMRIFVDTIFPWATQEGKTRFCSNSCQSSCSENGQPPIDYKIGNEDCTKYFVCECSKMR